jgi:hypothetical protein
MGLGIVGVEKKTALFAGVSKMLAAMFHLRGAA